MKKTLILLIIITFTSCHIPRYTYFGNVNSSLDFSKGRWLLNDIESSKNIKNNLTKIADKEFSKLLGNRFSILNETEGILIPRKITSNPSKSILKDIKNGTGFDFFINIRTETMSDEIGDIQIGHVYSKHENSVEINIEIYDLNLLEKIYSQSVIGNLSIPEDDNQDFAFAKGTNRMIINGFKKIMKKIKKNQRKN